MTMMMVLPSSRFETLQHREDFFRRCAIEVAGRFVGDDQRRVGDDCAGNRDALLLSARQLRRIVMRTVRRG